MAYRWDHPHPSPCGPIYSSPGASFEVHSHTASPFGPLGAVQGISVSAGSRAHSHASACGLVSITEADIQRKLLVQDGNYATFVKLEVDRDGAGTFVDLTNAEGNDWLISLAYQENVDDPCASASVVLKREIGNLSLSPLVETSAMNLVSGVYTPMLDVWRRLRFYTAIVAIGSQPMSGDWVMRFDGRVDRVDVGGDSIKLECRDRSAELDRFIRTVLVYGTAGGSPIETEIQALLTNTMGASAFTLYTPVSPSWSLTEWQQQKAVLRDAIRALAQQIGWDVKYLWDAGTSAFRLTLFCPDRAKVTPDFTLTSDQYVMLPSVALSRENVRNYGEISWLDRASETPLEYTSSDATSISRFGELYIGIGEASTSNIDSTTEATRMMDAIVADLATPVLEQTAETPYLPTVELGTMIRFSADGVHYDSDKDLAVTSINHKFEQGGCSTSLGLRGKPSGGYERWLALELRAGIPPDNFVSAHCSTPQTTTGAVLDLDVVDSDEAGLLDTSTGIITIQQPGMYQINLSCKFTSNFGSDTANAGAWIVDYDNPGSPTGIATWGTMRTTAGTSYQANPYWVGYLPAGKKIVGYLTCSPADTITNDVDPSATFLQLRKIS